jgi:membrane protease YdiL (CAAX protease family)
MTATTSVALSHPHPEPRSYPLMLRTWTYEWWRPVVGVLLLLVGMLVVVPVILLPVLAALVALDHNGSFSDAFQNAASLDHVTWQGMLYLNLALAGLIPVTWLIVRYLHRLRPRWLMSVKPGIRWPFFWACFGLAVVAMIAQGIVGTLLPTDPNDLGGSPNHITSRIVALGLVVLFTTPLQAIGEEYAFRGYAMQAFGALSRRPWVAILISAALFALAHGIQNAPLFLDRFTFGLMAGYVVYRTGGLEAGIALHIWNNLVAFGFALLLSDIDDTLNVTEISWWNIPLTITQNGVYLVLVLLVARSMGLTNRTSPPVPPPTAPPTVPPSAPPSGPPVLVPPTPPV